MKRTHSTRRQTPVKGGRIPAATSFIQRVEDAIQKDMRRFHCSRAFVIATCCGYALDVEEQEDYHIEPGKPGKQLTLVKKRA